MDYQAFIELVMARGAIADRAVAERTLEATLTVLRQRLDATEARLLADALPAELAQYLRPGGDGGPFGLGEFYDRIWRLEGSPRGFAVEHAQVVCQLVAEALSEDHRHRLQRHLPPDFAALFTPRKPAPPPPEHVLPARDPREGRTLASGRPGSAHPLSEARADRTHTHSVAREENPHGESKLSSAAGLTQERERETLATGKPGPKHPLSGG
jgi:uncharacterized protein (DUF2267 family)